MAPGSSWSCREKVFGPMPPDTPVAATVLIVDDETPMLQALESILRTGSYVAILASSGAEALKLASSSPVDLVILDLALGDMSGLEVCRELRTFLQVPILVLTVRDSEVDKITALDLGADDYLTKPFLAGELLARIRALLRRAEPQLQPAVVTSGDLVVDLSARTVTLGGAEVGLTRTEFDVLAALASNADRVVTAQRLVEMVWGNSEADRIMSLRVQLSRLRGKLEPDSASPHHIVTEPGVGYRFVTDA